MNTTLCKGDLKQDREEASNNNTEEKWTEQNGKISMEELTRQHIQYEITVVIYQDSADPGIQRSFE